MRLPSLKGLFERRHRETSSSSGVAGTPAAPVVKIDAELAELIPQYLSNRWADLAFARQLLKNGDYVLLSRMAHRIKDGATSHGFTGLGDIAQTLEAAAEQSDPNAARAQLEAFDTFLRSVRIDYV